MTSPVSQRSIHPRFFHPTGVFTEITRADLERSIPDLFARWARAGAARPAIRTQTRTVSYAGLDATARRIASAIRTRSGPANEPVTVLVRDPTMVVAAALGALMARKILVVLDPLHPAARNAAVLEDAAPSLVLTDRATAELAAALGVDAVRQLLVDEPLASPSAEPSAPPEGPGDLAAIIYTSGTTGRPKGVVHGHESLMHLLREIVNAVRLTPEDRVALLQPFTTIAGFRGVWTPLVSGGTLCPFDVTRQGLADLAAWLRHERISFVHMVPTLFRHLAACLAAGDRFPDLRAVRLGGESVSRRDYELYCERFAEHAAFVLTYNASEVSTIAWFLGDGDVAFDGDVVPVGYPREGTAVLLLDDERRPVCSGETGEIALRSRFMARGYWGRPDLTAARFLPDPEGGDERIYLSGDLGRLLPDGRLLHCGRKDAQVKVRGFRIEPAEIEGAIMEEPDVREAAVVVRGPADGGRLIAYVVPLRPSGPSVADLRRRLRRRLPAHMMPSSIVVLESMPLTAGGKVARQELPAPGRERPDLGETLVPPRTPVESELAAIWRDILDLEAVGVDDRFLDLGGTSLDATRIAARVQGAFGADLSAVALLAAPTIADMALTVVETLCRLMPETADILRAGSLEAESLGGAAPRPPARTERGPLKPRTPS